MARSLSTRFRAPRVRPGPSFPEALARLKAGGVLRLTYIRNAPVWDLDDFPVSPEVVSLLTFCSEVAPDNDGLFDGAAPQSWRLRR
jgi:hypothetical protein